MKKILFSIIFLFVAASTFAQDDDIPTYHSKRENFAKVMDQNIRADLATFTLAGLDEATGKELLDYVPIVDYNDDSVVLSKDNIQVKILTKKFEPAKHKILYYDDKYVTKIDNRPYYGIVGQMPKKYIASVTVIIGRDTINLPPTAYNDLYEPIFCVRGMANAKTRCNTGVFLSKDGHRLYVYMLNSPDGKSGYEVTWMLQDKQYNRRILDFDF